MHPVQGPLRVLQEKTNTMDQDHPENTQDHPENTQDRAKNTQDHLGGSYLQVGVLKQPVTVPLDGRNGGSRTVNGKYGPKLELPINIDGMPFIVSIPADKGDGAVLKATFGPDLQSWAGKMVRVSESPSITRIRVQPA